MGKFYNPPDDIPKIGRILSGNSFVHLKSQLNPGEVLFGYFQRDSPGNYSVAAYLWDDNRMQEFVRQYGLGISQYEYYAVSDTILPKLTG